MLGVASNAKQAGSGAQSVDDAFAPTRRKRGGSHDPVPAPTETTAELDFRENDGIAVSLLWHRQTNRLSVTVADSQLGESFTLAARSDNARDVFLHPYAYAQLLAA